MQKLSSVRLMIKLRDDWEKVGKGQLKNRETVRQQSRTGATTHEVTSWHMVHCRCSQSVVWGPQLFQDPCIYI